MLLGIIGVLQRYHPMAKPLFRAVIALASLQLMLSLIGCGDHQDDRTIKERCDDNQREFAFNQQQQGKQVWRKYVYDAKTDTCQVRNTIPG